MYKIFTAAETGYNPDFHQQQNDENSSEYKWIIYYASCSKMANRNTSVMKASQKEYV